jgi:hypothetical protein
MIKRSAVTLAMAALMLGISAIGAPALAKCPKGCKTAIATEFKSCKAACPKGSAGKACKTTCRQEHSADKKACKAATNPTPPTCGEAA